MKKLTILILAGGLVAQAAFGQLTISPKPDPVVAYFALTANGSAIGPTIADYFGSNSSFPTETNASYEMLFDLFFLKTTAGTLTITVTNTQTYTSISGEWWASNIAGLATGGTSISAGMASVTTAAAAFPVGGTLATAVNHHIHLRVRAVCATAGNIRLQVTSSAGTITPLRDSEYTVRKTEPGNIGVFVP